MQRLPQLLRVTDALACASAFTRKQKSFPLGPGVRRSHRLVQAKPQSIARMQTLSEWAGRLTIKRSSFIRR